MGSCEWMNTSCAEVLRWTARLSGDPAGAPASGPNPLNTSEKLLEPSTLFEPAALHAAAALMLEVQSMPDPPSGMTTRVWIVPPPQGFEHRDAQNGTMSFEVFKSTARHSDRKSV